MCNGSIEHLQTSNSYGNFCAYLFEAAESQPWFFSHRNLDCVLNTVSMHIFIAYIYGCCNEVLGCWTRLHLVLIITGKIESFIT